MNYGYIYDTSCIIDDKRYIGKKKGKYNPNYLGSGTYLKNAINKHGRNNFNKPIVLTHTESKEEQNECEKYFIAEYRNIFGDNGLYNITAGGDGFCGNHSQETKKKFIGNKNGIGKRSEKTKQNISLGKKNIKFTEEHKSNLRLAWKKRPPVSEETKIKIKFAKQKRKELLGYINSPETRLKIKLAIKNRIKKYRYSREAI